MLWLVWAGASALGVAAAVALDVLLIAVGYLPAVPALVLTMVFPIFVGAWIGIARRHAAWFDHALGAAVFVGILYVVIVDGSVVGIITTSNVSCAEPNAPVNCDNDIGTGVGVVLGMFVAAGYGVLWWTGALVGGWIARWALRGRQSSGAYVSPE